MQRDAYIPWSEHVINHMYTLVLVMFPLYIPGRLLTWHNSLVHYSLTQEEGLTLVKMFEITLMPS